MHHNKVLEFVVAAPGMVFDYAGTVEPAGFLFCYGQAVSRTAYPELFAAIGTTYGAGNGTTTFNVPDCRGRVVAGKDNMGGTAASRLTSAVVGQTLGAVGGAEAHTLTAGQMPVHNHAVTDPGHAHSVYDPGHSHTQQSWNLTSFDGTGGPHQVGADAPASGGLGATNYVSYVGTGIGIYAAATGISTQNNGSGAAHNNTQPTIVLNKIIKT